jgi:PIN domain nuclease of toxin-antitoxin system
MRILLDTQCWLWIAVEPERLSARARSLVENERHEVYFSAASAWEIAIKHATGKLPLPEPPERYVPRRVEALRTLPLAIDQAHALRVARLPRHHNDPFDRLLIAQAQVEDLTIITADPKFAAYDVSIIPAM